MKLQKIYAEAVEEEALKQFNSTMALECVVAGGFIENTLKDEYRKENKVATIPEEVKMDILNTAKHLHKQAEWDLPNPYVTGERFKRWYGMRNKKVVLLKSKPRNKTSHDRLGSIDY